MAGPEFDDAPDDAAAEESDLVEETMHERIERELNELEAEAKTGVRFVIARQGMRLGEFVFPLVAGIKAGSG